MGAIISKAGGATILILFLCCSLLVAGFFAYEWWQKSEESVKQIEANENLREQVSELQEQVEKVTREKDIELANQVGQNEKLTVKMRELQKEIAELKTSQIIEHKIEDKNLEVTITTDKIEYRRGETVKITVRNGLNKSIWYTDFGCYPWWKLEVQLDKNWERMELLLPTLTKYGEECIACPPPQSIEEVLRELKLNSEIRNIWNLRYCKEANPSFIDPGNYRLAFTYGLNKSSWDEKTTYSNEFVIKAD